MNAVARWAARRRREDPPPRAAEVRRAAAWPEPSSRHCARLLTASPDKPDTQEGVFLAARNAVVAVGHHGPPDGDEHDGHAAGERRVDARMPGTGLTVSAPSRTRWNAGDFLSRRSTVVSAVSIRCGGCASTRAGGYDACPRTCTGSDRAFSRMASPAAAGPKGRERRQWTGTRRS